MLNFIEQAYNLTSNGLFMVLFICSYVAYFSISDGFSEEVVFELRKLFRYLIYFLFALLMLSLFYILVYNKDREYIIKMASLSLYYYLFILYIHKFEIKKRG